MNAKSVLRSSLVALAMALLFGTSAHAQDSPDDVETVVIDLTNAGGNGGGPLPPGVIRVPFCHSAKGQGPNAAAATNDAIVKCAKKVVDGAKALGHCAGANTVFIEITVSEAAGDWNPPNGDVGKIWRMKGFYVLKPTKPCIFLIGIPLIFP